MTRRFFYIALVLAAPLSARARGEKVLLQYRQPAGVALDYKAELDGTVRIQQLEGWVRGEKGAPRTIVYRKELGSSVEVAGRRDGEMDVVYRFGRGFIEKREGGIARREEIDLGGKDIRIKMRQNGCARVENMDVLEDVLSRTGAQSVEEPLFPVFPRKGLRVGATWKQKFTRRGLLIEGKPTRYVVTYRLAGIEEHMGMRCAVIEGGGALRLRNYSGATRSGKKVDIIESEEETESVLYFAVDRGIPVESRKTVKRREVREWEAKGGKEPFKDELAVQVRMRTILVGPGDR